MKQVDIFCVEDNEDFRFFLSRAFNKTSFEVTVHYEYSGNAAITALKTSSTTQIQPRLILLDISLPDLSGLEILKFIKQSNDLRKIPVVMLSSSDNPKDINQSFIFGANAYITKPMGIIAIQSMIEDVCKFWLNHNYTSAKSNNI